ncbi:TetR family transcriptional regulator [Streptomyces alkaliphilus]|uniref:TetR family transcriptional regulator n=2 Tax=Streptomyces alkaliphilus TaxID=1472722 RepID=A0A7W3Y2F3_9ACTN|nr:TetR family transcriptional regulator [Streptomyces alkaliphilus]
MPRGAHQNGGTFVHVRMYTRRGMGSTEQAEHRGRPAHRRARDPEGRRAAIVEAAVAVIADHGIGGTTHRLIATRAGVPLGSTTYYFPSLGDLVDAALARVADECRSTLAGWGEALAAAPDTPGPVIAGAAAGYLENRDRAIVEYDLYLAAARDERLRPLVDAWVGEMTRVVATVCDARTAGAVTALVDGALIQALVTGRPLDGDLLARSVESLITGSDSGGNLRKDAPESSRGGTHTRERKQWRSAD